jgi:hypothetical protein
MTVGCLAVGRFAVAAEPAAARPQTATRLPQNVLPTIGCWFWREAEFQPGGFRPFLDMVADHASYNLLTTSIRAPNVEVTGANIHDQIKAAAEYARPRGIGLVMDLDVRLARAAFQRAYPHELQEMLRLREAQLSDVGEATIATASETPSDHYTFRTTPYIPLAGRLVRAYSYVRGPDGIEPASIQEVTGAACHVKEASAKQVAVAIACGPQGKRRRACLMAAFTHFTPDVFAPHLLSFQREILKQYADAPLRGVCKDEWGFPPCFDGNPAQNDYWFSTFFAAAYAERTGGRDLVRDTLLMTFGERGRVEQRQAAVNHFMALCRQRNAAIEGDFYQATKDTFGPNAMVATHPTWWPYPGIREFKKNGLDWWAARRDWAQVDEVTPFCVRTALAKKWGSPIWYNMFYAPQVADYETSLWTHALAGGRINYHPLWPVKDAPGGLHAPLLRGDLTRGDCRVRLLNFIARAPLDCPVAVIFGHACATNWAGPAYEEVGMALANRLWQAGFYADLIPSSEIADQAVKIDKDGSVCYGPQRYAAVVLYHPEFEQPATAAFFRQAANGPTALFRVGGWSKDFDGKPVGARCALPESMTVAADAAACAAEVVKRLRAAHVAPQEPATRSIGWSHVDSATPPTHGHCRLLDGTHLFLAGEKNVAGDPIHVTFPVDGREVTIDCVGVAGVRFDASGTLCALAAGGLKQFHAGALDIRLQQPVDMALWRDDRRQMHGVLQDWNGPVPAALAGLSAEWLRLAVPAPLSDATGQ